MTFHCERCYREGQKQAHGLYITCPVHGYVKALTRDDLRSRAAEMESVRFSDDCERSEAWPTIKNSKA